MRKKERKIRKKQKRQRMKEKKKKNLMARKRKICRKRKRENIKKRKKKEFEVGIRRNLINYANYITMTTIGSEKCTKDQVLHILDIPEREKKIGEGVLFGAKYFFLIFSYKKKKKKKTPSKVNQIKKHYI